jgi:Na+-transporting methylmalonyl-CoA/oxaloacetate decarboxylase beta subunit
MKKEEIQQLSTEELMKKEASLKKANNVLIVLLALLFIAGIYLCIKEKTFHPLIVVPLGLSGIAVNNFNVLKLIKAEKEER